MVQVGYGDSFVMADMPGLIEGAHSGAGLGIQFLRHIERTRVLLHVLDMSELEGRDPYEDYKTINDELESYNLRLMERPQIIVANKMDMPEAAERLADETAYYGFEEEEKPFKVSRDDDGGWRLYGDKIERLFIMTNFDHDESVMKFARQMRAMGVDETLRSMGAKDGDYVRIQKFEFEFVD